MLQSAGFVLIFKPTVRYFENGKETVKGNVDAELVLHSAAIEYPNYGKAIIISGDGDFACLVEHLADNNKLLKPYSKYIVELQQLKSSLEYKKTGIGGRSKP